MSKKYTAPLEKELDESNMLQEHLGGLRHQYSVGMLGEMMSQLSELVKAANTSEKPYFDSELKESLSMVIGNLTETMGKLVPREINMAPFITISGEISTQNKRILETLISIQGQSTNEERYEKLINLTLSMIEKNNQFMQAMMAKLNEEPPAPEKIKEWDFKVTERDDKGRLKSIKAKAV